MYEITYPFQPPMEDCRMQHTTDKGAKVYIFDTFCKNRTPEEKQRDDAEIVRIYNDILMRVAMEQQSGKG